MARLDLDEYRRIFASDLPTPVDVPNLLMLAPNDAYRTYSRLVAPLLGMVRGKVRWAGRHTHSVAGECRAQKFMVVSYPNHRRFMAMVANPYYLFANRWRQRGVDHFEASFTTPVRQRSGLRRQPCVLVVHFDSNDGPHDAPSRPTLDQLEEVLGDSGARLLYASVETTPLTFLTHLKPNDPNALVYPETAVFGVSSTDAAAASLDADALHRVEALVPGAALQLYERLSVREMLL